VNVITGLHQRPSPSLSAGVNFMVMVQRVVMSYGAVCLMSCSSNSGSNTARTSRRVEGGMEGSRVMSGAKVLAELLDNTE
jgi:hypothetical protein